MQEARLFTGVTLGAGVGYLLGILIAPRSGQETRQKIQHAAEDAKTKVKEGFDTGKEMTTELTDRIRKKAGELAKKSDEQSELALDIRRVNPPAPSQPSAM